MDRSRDDTEILPYCVSWKCLSILYKSSTSYVVAHPYKEEVGMGVMALVNATKVRRELTD